MDLETQKRLRWKSSFLFGYCPAPAALRGERQLQLAPRILASDLRPEGAGNQQARRGNDRSSSCQYHGVGVDGARILFFPAKVSRNACLLPSFVRCAPHACLACRAHVSVIRSRPLGSWFVFQEGPHGPPGALPSPSAVGPAGELNLRLLQRGKVCSRCGGCNITHGTVPFCETSAAPEKCNSDRIRAGWPSAIPVPGVGCREETT